MHRTLLLFRAAVVFGLLGTCSLAIVAGPDLARQVGQRQKGPDGGSGRKEEEDDDKPARPKKKDITRFEDPLDKDKAPAPVVPVPSGDLRAAAKLARHAHVKALYEELATEHDRVTFKGAKHVTASGQKLGGVVWVEPLPDYFPTPRDIKGRLSLNILDKETGKKADSYATGAGAIEDVKYYEQVAGDQVAEFLKQPFQSFPPDNKLYLTRYNQLLAAEAVLSRAVSFHESARKRGVRKGDEWDDVEARLKGQLLAALIGQLEELTAARSWDAAFALSKRLIDTFPSKDQHAQIAKPLADLLKKSLGDSTASRERLREARKRLQQIEERFPTSEVITEISKSLRAQAGALAKAAEKLKETDKEGALRLVRQAEEIWPEYPGLRSLRVQLEDSYQILRVGVRTQPRYLSPGWAATDSELRAVELQFESLVDLVPDERGALYYRPVLAQGRPRVVHLGRELRLPREAKWSNGKALTVNDVRNTLDRLQRGRGDRGDTSYRCRVTGRCAAWGDLLTGLKMEGDPYRLKLQMPRGRLDPLGAMSFKVLPATNKPDPASEAFATNPISSGPFQFTAIASEEGKGRYIGFSANPYYAARIDRVGKPLLSEVRLFGTSDYKDVKELVSKMELDLVLDLTAEQAAALKADAGWVVPLPSADAPNRRVSFLAVNHRGGASNPLSNADVRIALARAIDREGLLDEYFRKGLTTKVHRALNGPFPAGSWACDPKLAKEKTYDPDLARAKLAQALKKLGLKEVRLRLIYPSGDPQLKEAMEALCARVAKAAPGLVLEAGERSPYELRHEVEVTHDFDLAYLSYDFPDESFWLLPLLGPSGRGGSDNFLGYNGPLVARAQQAAALRNFSQVRDHARLLHKQFHESEMPLIPLWQLDPLYAHRPHLVLPPIDPQKVFTRVEEWRKTKK